MSSTGLQDSSEQGIHLFLIEPPKAIPCSKVIIEPGRFAVCILHNFLKGCFCGDYPLHVKQAYSLLASNHLQMMSIRTDLTTHETIEALQASKSNRAL